MIFYAKDNGIILNFMFPLQLLFLTWLQEHCMICGIMPRTLFEINVKLLRRFFVQSVFIGYCVVNNLFSLRDVWGYKDYGRHHLPRLMKCKFHFIFELKNFFAHQKILSILSPYYYSLNKVCCYALILQMSSLSVSWIPSPVLDLLFLKRWKVNMICC